jgi:hypothetical protein
MLAGGLNPELAHQHGSPSLLAETTWISLHSYCGVVVLWSCGVVVLWYRDSVIS